MLDNQARLEAQVSNLLAILGARVVQERQSNVSTEQADEVRVSNIRN